MENYFNYFTEIEECFQRFRGVRALLSPLDWALIESWKEAGIPLEAVRIGIERAFEKFAKRPRRFQRINGLAYCTQTVMQAAEEMKTAQAQGGAGTGTTRRAAEPPFTAEQIEAHVNRNAEILESAAQRWREAGQAPVSDDLAAAGAALRGLAATEASEATVDFERLENTLSAVEDKLTASVTRAASVELLAAIRREAERGLGRCRREMTGPQIESLERQFLKKRLFEHYGIPRLSLFYL